MGLHLCIKVEGRVHVSGEAAGQFHFFFFGGVGDRHSKAIF